MDVAQTSRQTRQRQVILEELAKVRTHPTADELYQKVRRRLPKVSIATIYRNLEALADQGMVRKLAMAGEKKRFDASTNEHYHLRCDRCGAVSDLPIDRIAAIESAMDVFEDMTITGYRLEFSGLCMRCDGK